MSVGRVRAIREISAALGRSAGQAPLHRLHAAGIAAADNDAEVGARLIPARGARCAPFRRPLRVGHALGAMGEFVPGGTAALAGGVRSALPAPTMFDYFAAAIQPLG